MITSAETKEMCCIIISLKEYLKKKAMWGTTERETSFEHYNYI